MERWIDDDAQIRRFYAHMAEEIQSLLKQRLPHAEELRYEYDDFGLEVKAPWGSNRRYFVVSRYFGHNQLAISFADRHTYHYDIYEESPALPELAAEEILSFIGGCIETWIFQQQNPGTFVACNECPRQLMCLTLQDRQLTVGRYDAQATS